TNPRLLMKQLFLLITLGFMTVQVFAQSDELKARIEYGEAEKAFSEEDFGLAIKHLDKAEALLGQWTPLTGYLRILCLDKATDYSDNNETSYSGLAEQLAKYIAYANANGADIDESKFRDIYTIEQKVVGVKQR